MIPLGFTGRDFFVSSFSKSQHFRMTYIKTIIFLFVWIPVKLFAQPDSIKQSELTTSNLSCFYIVDKIWTDKSTAYKRDPYGVLNFIEIENGAITAITSSSKVRLNFHGPIENLETVLIDEVNTLKLHSREYNHKGLDGACVFEIYQDDEQVMVHVYPKRVLTDYYFQVHTATDAEIAGIRKIIAENMPKY